MNTPRSLLWRLGTLALGVTLLSLVLHVSLMAVWIRPLVDQLMEQHASRAQMTRAMLIAAAPSQRDALASRLSGGPFQVLRGALPDDEGPGPPPPMPALTERLGPDFELGRDAGPPWSLRPRALRFGFNVEGEPWQMELTAQPPLQALLGTGLGWLMLAAAAVAASLLVGVRFIVEPIRQVAARIADQGATLQPLAQPAHASTEVRSLVESVNRLIEKVQAADHTKTHLLAGVSHDLRTPLARLRLRIETQCEPRVAEAAEDELRAVEHIVSQFLAYVQGGSRPLPGSEQSVHHTLEDMVRGYGDEGVRIELALEADDVRMSAVELRRAVTNLVDNALAYGRLPVRITWRAPQADRHELAVWDAGPGLSRAEFKEALEPFVRLSRGGGLGHCGLGLAIVAQIAAQWQAELEPRRDGGRFGVVLTWHAQVLNVRVPLPAPAP